MYGRPIENEGNPVTRLVNSVKIPFMTGRPERTRAINEEDILNLSIALNTAKTFEEFLALT